MKIIKLTNEEIRKALEISSPSLLADIGKSVGFRVVDVVEHGLSKADKGKIGVEDIIVFQK